MFRDTFYACILTRVRSRLFRSTQKQRSCKSTPAHDLDCVMGNLVRACLGREYSLFNLQRRTTLSWDLLMVFKVLCYALFDVTPRSAYSEETAGVRTRRCSASSPANLLRLLYRRHVLKSKVDTNALCRYESFSKEKHCRFSVNNEDDHGSSVYGGRQIESSMLELLNRLQSEVQNLKSRLDRQEGEVQKLSEEMLSLRATAARSSVEPPVGKSRIGIPTVPAPENLLRDASEDSSSHPDFCLVKGGHLVKLENVYVFQKVLSKPQKTVDEVRHCTSKDSETGGADFEHQGRDLQSPWKVGTKILWEHSLEDRVSPVKLQSNARRSFDCKCVDDYIDREFVLDAETKAEMEADELDNLSIYSYDSADNRDFQYVGTPKRPKGGDDFQEQMEWSSEESSKDHNMMTRDQSLPWTNTDPEIAGRRTQVQQRSHELDEKLLKILQSPRREIIPQIINSNSSSRSSSGRSSPRSSTSSVARQSYAGQPEEILFCEPSRETECSKTFQNLWSDKKFHTDFDFATQTKAYKTANSLSKAPTHHSFTTESSGGEFDARILPHPRVTRREERLVTPSLTRQVSADDSTHLHKQTCARSGDSHGSSPAVDLGENRGELVDIVEVALEAYTVCPSGAIHRSDNRNRNRHGREDVVTATDSSLYRESNASSSMSCGVNHLRRHSSFGQGTRQSRFAVEAAKLSMRKHGHQRGGSF